MTQLEDLKKATEKLTGWQRPSACGGALLRRGLGHAFDGAAPSTGSHLAVSTIPISWPLARCLSPLRRFRSPSTPTWQQAAHWPPSRAQWRSALPPFLPCSDSGTPTRCGVGFTPRIQRERIRRQHIADDRARRALRVLAPPALHDGITQTGPTHVRRERARAPSPSRCEPARLLRPAQSSPWRDVKAARVDCIPDSTRRRNLPEYCRIAR